MPIHLRNFYIQKYIEGKKNEKDYVEKQQKPNSLSNPKMPSSRNIQPTTSIPSKFRKTLKK